MVTVLPRVGSFMQSAMVIDVLDPIQTPIATSPCDAGIVTLLAIFTSSSILARRVLPDTAQPSVRCRPSSWTRPVAVPAALDRGWGEQMP